MMVATATTHSHIKMCNSYIGPGPNMFKSHTNDIVNIVSINIVFLQRILYLSPRHVTVKLVSVKQTNYFKPSAKCSRLKCAMIKYIIFLARKV